MASNWSILLNQNVWSNVSTSIAWLARPQFSAMTLICQPVFLVTTFCKVLSIKIAHYKCIQFLQYRSILFQCKFSCIFWCKLQLNWIHQSMSTTLLSFLLFQDDLSKMRVVFNFLWLITDQVKFNYSLETLSYTSWNIKGVSSKSGTASNIYWQNVFIHKYRLLKIN